MENSVELGKCTKLGVYFSFSVGQRKSNSFVLDGKCDSRDMFKKMEEFKRPIRKGIEVLEIVFKKISCSRIRSRVPIIIRDITE